MSEKRSKAERKKEGDGKPEKVNLGNHMFDVTISIYDTGKFTIYAPEGAQIPLALDCCMRACHQLWTLIVQKFSKGSQPPLVVPGMMADIDLIQKIKRGFA